jgi:hypothetical protein
MNDFFSNSFLKKKAVYSQTTFALLLILYFSLMMFAYFYYEHGVEEYTKLQIENSHLDLFSLVQQSVLKSVVLEDQIILLEPVFSQDSTEILLNSSYVDFTSFSTSFKIENIYFLSGISFCDTYDLYFELPTTFLFNGSCIIVNSP